MSFQIQKYLHSVQRWAVNEVKLNRRVKPFLAVSLKDLASNELCDLIAKILNGSLRLRSHLWHLQGSHGLLSSVSFHPRWDWNISTTFLKRIKRSWQEVLWRRQEMGSLRGKSSTAAPWLGVCSSCAWAYQYSAEEAVCLCTHLSSLVLCPADSQLCLLNSWRLLVVPAFPLPALWRGNSRPSAGAVCSPSHKGHRPVLSEVQCLKFIVSYNFSYFFHLFHGEGRSGSCSSVLAGSGSSSVIIYC